jgi:hypothetical protein
MMIIATLFKKFWPELVLVIGILTAGGVAYVAIYERGAASARQACTSATDALKRTAATTLATEQAKTRALELGLQIFTDTQNAKDYQNAKTVTALSDRLRRTADSAGRLRDPNAPGCGGSGGGAAPAAASAAADRAADPAVPGGLLSAELSGLLRERLEQADRINDAYASCRAVAIRLTAVP